MRIVRTFSIAALSIAAATSIICWAQSNTNPGTANPAQNAPGQPKIDTRGLAQPGAISTARANQAGDALTAGTTPMPNLSPGTGLSTGASITPVASPTGTPVSTPPAR